LADFESERGLARILCAVRKRVRRDINEKKGRGRVIRREMKW